MVECPICGNIVKANVINAHIDSACKSFTEADSPLQPLTPQSNLSSSKKTNLSTFFQAPSAKRTASLLLTNNNTTPSCITSSDSKSSASVPPKSQSLEGGSSPKTQNYEDVSPFEPPSVSPVEPPSISLVEPPPVSPLPSRKRSFVESNLIPNTPKAKDKVSSSLDIQPVPKKLRVSNNTRPKVSAPLAERMRPISLDDVYGQDLVGPKGILRALIEQDQIPSMILWGGPGTGKTTIARCLASHIGSRLVEISSTSSGTAEWKKILVEARRELSLTGRKTIVFCDEMHRFSKSQQDIFLAPVESGHITLIGATTENPSFRVQGPLLSRCRTFTLSKLTPDHLQHIMERALATLDPPPSSSTTEILDNEFLAYISAFADGDARTALNLLELAMSLSSQPSPSSSLSSTLMKTKDEIKASLTKTLVYDRAGDQHYDTISAFHKSVRGSNPDAALYYLARMLQSGEDPIYIARRIVVIASEDIGLADNSMLTLATSAYTAAEKIGMPECRIALAHATVALCLAPKSTRSYRGLKNAYAALQEPGVAALPIPIHLRNAPTKLMKELGHGDQYKYNPNYKEGKVRQDYLPEQLIGRVFLEDQDLGTEIDPDAWPL